MEKPIRVVGRLRSEAPPEPGDGLRIALYQGEDAVGSRAAVDANLGRLAEVAGLAGRYRCHVCVFPEKFTSGYAISKEQCERLAEPQDGPSIALAREIAIRNGIAIVLPYPERFIEGEETSFYDSIALIDPQGEVLANYRKSHLYGAAERRNYSFGNELPPVVRLNGCAVGLLNCYECEFPPLYQYLAEAGARIVIGPTAADFHFTLASGAESQVPYQDATEHIIPAMASVWRLFVAYCNRRGWERVGGNWWQYRGNSGVWGPDGAAVVAADAEDRTADALFVADCLLTGYVAFSPEGNHLHDNRLGLDLRLRSGR